MFINSLMGISTYVIHRVTLKIISVQFLLKFYHYCPHFQDCFHL